MTARSLESRKPRKIDRETQRKKEILRRQREEEDFWDEYEDFSLESSSDESNCDGSIQDDSSEEEDWVTEKKRGDGGTFEGLGDDDDGGVQLEGEERNFKPSWKGDAGGYLRGAHGCGPSATEKRERRCKRELEKSASQTRSIVEMFSIQINKKKFHSAEPAIDSPPPPPSAPKSLQKTSMDKKQIGIELRTQAVKDLDELLRCKTEQMSKYGHVIAHKSNYYCRHQMVQSFLWMQLNKEKNTVQLDQ